MFAADLSAILNSDISEIAENVEIPVPDSTDDCDETRINYTSIVSHQHVNQVNHHVNHIHLHGPSSPQPSEDSLESVCAKNRRGHPELKQLAQTRKLIFDSKVVPIKPDDRSAGLLQRTINSSKGRSNVLMIGNMDKDRRQLNVIAMDSECRSVSTVVMDSKPMQSTEVSASTNGMDFEQPPSKIRDIAKWNPILEE